MTEITHAFSYPEISFLQQAKLQAQVIVPVLRALRERLGVKEANTLVAEALRDWSREQFRRAAEAAGGAGLESWAPVWENGFAKIGDGFELDVLRHDEYAQDFNVTRCPYAEFFRALDEPELGAILMCEADIYLAEEIGGDDVEFSRTRTIMNGAYYCDFRIRMRSD
jgi:hypothetical protein